MMPKRGCWPASLFVLLVVSLTTAAQQADVLHDVRRAAPPTNWTLYVSAPMVIREGGSLHGVAPQVCPNVYRLRPYDDVCISILGPDYQKERWQVSERTKIDGNAIGKDAQILTVEGFATNWKNREESGIEVVRSYLPYFQYPAAVGKHTIELVLSTGRNNYYFEPFTILLSTTYRERRVLTEFESSGASEFLTDPYGFEPADGGRTTHIQYSHVLTFVERYPRSYLTKIVESRIQLIWLWDVNERGACRNQDRRWLGKILGAIDRQKHLAFFHNEVVTYRKISQQSRESDVCGLWLDAVASYRQ